MLMPRILKADFGDDVVIAFSNILFFPVFLSHQNSAVRWEMILTNIKENYY